MQTSKISVWQFAVKVFFHTCAGVSVSLIGCPSNLNLICLIDKPCKFKIINIRETTLLFLNPNKTLTDLLSEQKLTKLRLKRFNQTGNLVHLSCYIN